MNWITLCSYELKYCFGATLYVYWSQGWQITFRGEGAENWKKGPQHIYHNSFYGNCCCSFNNLTMRLWDSLLLATRKKHKDCFFHEIAVWFIALMCRVTDEKGIHIFYLLFLQKVLCFPQAHHGWVWGRKVRIYKGARLLEMAFSNCSK